VVCSRGYVASCICVRTSPVVVLQGRSLVRSNNTPHTDARATSVLREPSSARASERGRLEATKDMNELPQAPARQHVPAKHVALILSVVAYVVASLTVAQLYSGQLGLLMLAPLLVGFVVAFLRVPREQWASIAAANKKQEQTALGRIVRFIEIAVLIYLATMALRWLYERL